MKTNVLLFKSQISRVFILTMLVMFSMVSGGCEKEGSGGNSCASKVCQNGGYCSDGTCICPDGFSGSNCQNDNRPPCEKNNTGTIVFDNYSSNPYDCFVNGQYRGRVNGYGVFSVNVAPGSVSLKARQYSGYVLYPSEFNATGSVLKCYTTTFKFP
jgi:hypothetical protein